MVGTTKKKFFVPEEVTTRFKETIGERGEKQKQHGTNYLLLIKRNTQSLLNN